MKQFYLLLTLPLFALAFQSCEEEPVIDDHGNNGNSSKMVFTATTENLESSADVEAFWLPGEQIKIVLNDGNSVVATLVDGAGTSTASFVGTIPGGKTALFAVHPTSALDSAEGNAANINIPDSQSGGSAPETISVGKIETGNKIDFKNVNAVLGLQLKAGTEVSKIEVTSVDGSALAGKMSVDCSGSVPQIGSVKSPSSTVSTTIFGAGTYYLTVAPGAHTKGLKIKTYTEDPNAEAVEYDYDISTITANNVYVYEIKEVIASKTYYVTVEGAGNKDGKSLENAMSAAQMWSFLKLEDKTVTDLNGSVFNLGSGTYDWGNEATLSFEEGARFSIIGQKDETIFSGNNEHRIIQVDGEVEIEIEGISFVNGQVTVAAEGGEDGGAIKISSGTWAFKNCSFSGNKATNGGAIEITGGSVTITDCAFNNNEALNDDPERKDGTGYGGAIDCDTETGTIVISGCTFSENMAWIGGAVDIYKTSSEALVENSSFTNNGNELTRDAGAVFIAASTSMRNCTLSGNRAKYGAAMKVKNHHISIEGGSFKDNVASGNAGAISVGEKGRLEIGNEQPVTFQGNSAALYGGALEVESFRDNLGNNIHNSIFKENNAQWGGAVAVYGKSGKSTNMYFKDCTVEGNYASSDGGAFYVEDESLIDLTRTTIIDNHADNMGGAVCIHGWKGVQAFQSTFKGNYAATGGAIYSEGSGDKYSYLYIDECSFDSNYITKRYGCTININGLDMFCMNNSSVRGSYTTTTKSSYKKGLNASWIAIDVIQTCSSISNCSIIGDTQNSAEGDTLADNTALVGVMGTATHFFTNNIIVPVSDGVASIGGEADSEITDLCYTLYNKLVKTGTNTDNGGNESGVLASAIGSLTWADAGYWQWDGKIDGSAPAMMTQAAIVERLTAICPEFVEWCGEDINKDQRNASRGESWWPGAYQN